MTAKPAVAVAPPPMIVHRWRRISMLGLIFFCGVVVGAVSGGNWMRIRMVAIMQHPEQLPDRVLPRIRAELSLSDAQAREVDAVVRRRHAAMEAHRADSYPKQLVEFHAMQSEIAELLSPEQRRNWSILCETVEQRYLPARPAVPPPADLIFYRFDADNDGSLTDDEVPAGMWRRLRTADEDGDGKVTRNEYQEARPNANSNSPPRKD